MVTVAIRFTGTAVMAYNDKYSRFGKEEIIERAIDDFQSELPFDVDIADIEVCYGETDYE